MKFNYHLMKEKELTMKRILQVLMMMAASLTVDAQKPVIAHANSLVFTDQFLEEQLVNVYPNPVIDVLNIEVRQADRRHLTVQIKDVIGKTIYNKTAGEFASGTYIFQVHMPAAPTGMYLYNIIDEKGTVVANGKFLKQ